MVSPATTGSLTALDHSAICPDSMVGERAGIFISIRSTKCRQKSVEGEERKEEEEGKAQGVEEEGEKKEEQVVPG